MAIQPIRFFGDPVLTTPATEVIDFDKELQRLVKDLTETMIDAPGAGLAAPQIGVPLRVFVWHVDDVFGHLINPTLDLSDEIQEGDEGCLSFPELSYQTPRAMRAATIVKPNSKHETIPENETQKSISRFDKLRNSNGGTPTSVLRDKMQRTMQKNCAVFRDAKILKEGMEEIRKPWKGMDDISVSDKSLIFNTDLIETLEFDNLIRQSLVTMASAENRKESRGAHSREDFKERDDDNWMKHTLAWQDGEKVKIDYRNVHNFTLSNEVQYFPPKARVY